MTTFDSRVPSLPTTQDPELFGQLQPLYQGSNQRDRLGNFSYPCTPASAVPTGKFVTATGTLAASSGAVGFFVGGQPGSNSGEIICLGINPFLSGLTPGASYYLSATAGEVTATAGTQYIGVAISETELLVKPS